MAFYPGYNPWNAWDGEYTASANWSYITIPALPSRSLVSPWHDTGSTLAKITFSGTATGTVYARFSETLPENRDLNYPISFKTSERIFAYDPTAGQLPTDQGFNLVDPYAATIVASGGTLRLANPTAGYVYYVKGVTVGPGQADASLAFEFKMRSPGHKGYQAVSMIFTTPSAGSRQFALYFTGQDAVQTWVLTANQLKLSSYPGTPIPGVPTLVMDTWYTVRVKFNTNPIDNFTSARVFARVKDGRDITNLDGFTDYGLVSVTRNSESGATDWYLYFANMLAGCESDVEWGEIVVENGNEIIEITDGQTSFSTNRRYVQIISDQANGTLTEFDILSDLSAPSNVETVTSNVLGTNNITGVATATSGANGYEFELLNASDLSVVQTIDVYDNGCVFTDVADGDYKIRVKAFTDDGIRSVSGVLTSTITIPYVAPVPAIALTIDNDELTAGQEATLTWVSSVGDLAVTLNGASVADNGSEIIATGSSATVTPPNQPASVNVISKPNRPTYIGVA